MIKSEDMTTNSPKFTVTSNAYRYCVLENIYDLARRTFVVEMKL